MKPKLESNLISDSNNNLLSSQNKIKSDDDFFEKKYPFGNRMHSIERIYKIEENNKYSINTNHNGRNIGIKFH